MRSDEFYIAIHNKAEKLVELHKEIVMRLSILEVAYGHNKDCNCSVCINRLLLRLELERLEQQCK